MRHWRRSLFVPLSCVATLLVYGVFSVFALQNVEKLRREFPYESMETRLPPAKIHLPLASLSPIREDRLAALESRLDEREQRSSYRASLLRTIHEDTVQAFVQQPDFGVARVSHMQAHFLRHGAYREPPIPQPGQPSPSPWLTDASTKQPYAPDGEDNLLILHEASILDFVNFAGLGFVKDRRHVAGFRGIWSESCPKPR